MRRGTPRAWLKNRVRPAAPSRDDEKEAERIAQRSRETALALDSGWAVCCGTTVVNGMHADDCDFVPAERRRAKGTG